MNRALPCDFWFHCYKCAPISGQVKGAPLVAIHAGGDEPAGHTERDTMNSARLHVPAWIVSTLGLQRTRKIATDTILELKLAGIGPADGITSTLDVLIIEAEAEQRRWAFGFHG